MSINERPPEVRHTVPGTGIEAWEMVKAWMEIDWDRLRLQAAYPHLTPTQIGIALQYARGHDEPILARIREDYARVPDDLASDLPDVPEHLPECTCSSTLR